MHVILALLLQAAPTAPPPDLQDILNRMYERVDRAAARQTGGATWHKNKEEQDITDETDLANPRNPKTEHREQYHVWGDGTRMIQQKTMRDGKKVSEASKPLSFFLDRKFLDSFQFVLAEPARVRCGTRVCRYLSFSPKPGGSERLEGVVGMEQRILGGASGTMQVDEEKSGIVRVDVRTTAPPVQEWYLTVHWVTVAITQFEFDGTMVTTRIDMKIALETPFGSKVKRMLYTFTEVKLPPLPPPPSE